MTDPGAERGTGSAPVAGGTSATRGTSATEGAPAAEVARRRRDLGVLALAVHRPRVGIRLGGVEGRARLLAAAHLRRPARRPQHALPVPRARRGAAPAAAAAAWLHAGDRPAADDRLRGPSRLGVGGRRRRQGRRAHLHHAVLAAAPRPRVPGRAAARHAGARRRPRAGRTRARGRPMALHDVRSSVLAVAGGVAWAASALVVKLMQRRHEVDVLSLTTWQMVFGSLPLIVVALLVGGAGPQWTAAFVAGALLHRAAGQRPGLGTVAVRAPRAVGRHGRPGHAGDARYRRARRLAAARRAAERGRGRRHALIVAALAVLAARGASEGRPASAGPPPGESPAQRALSRD